MYGLLVRQNCKNNNREKDSQIVMQEKLTDGKI